MSDEATPDALRRMIAALTGQVSAAPRVPQRGEIWFVENTVLGIGDRRTTDHPALVLVTNRPRLLVLVGTSNPNHYGADGFAVYPTDVIRSAGDGNLSGPTYFGLAPRRLPAGDLGPLLVRCAGRLAENRLAEMEQAVSRAAAGPRGTNP